MARPNNLTMCSFCGKNQTEVRKLIAGPGVYICDSCITICGGILEKELAGDRRKKRTPTDTWVLSLPINKVREMNDRLELIGGLREHKAISSDQASYLSAEIYNNLSELPFETKKDKKV